MLNDRIVFITGAGASMPFGYPSGIDLVHYISQSFDERYRFSYKKIVNGYEPGEFLVEKIVQDWSDYDIYLKLGFPIKELKRFKTKLEDSGLNSIDAFLENNYNLKEIGKAAIANIMLKFENLITVKLINHNWIRYLWNRIYNIINTLKPNQISFLTFNYDRIIEVCMYSYIMNSFNTEDDLKDHYLKKLELMPIIHIHGKLGQLPWETNNKEKIIDFGYNEVDFSNHFEKVNKTMGKIKIITDKRSLTDVDLLKARELLINANVVFLGFGYNERNLNRLLINDLHFESIKGTGYGLTNFQINRIRDKFPNLVQINNMIGDNLEFLRNFVI